MCTEERGGATAREGASGRRTPSRLVPLERGSWPLQLELVQWARGRLDVEGEVTESELTTEDKLLIPQVVNTIPFTI